MRVQSCGTIPSSRSSPAETKASYIQCSTLPLLFSETISRDLETAGGKPKIMLSLADVDPQVVSPLTVVDRVIEMLFIKTLEVLEHPNIRPLR